jgi:hypothetical protein
MLPPRRLPEHLRSVLCRLSPAGASQPFQERDRVVGAVAFEAPDDFNSQPPVQDRAEQVPRLQDLLQVGERLGVSDGGDGTDDSLLEAGNPANGAATKIETTAAA